MALDVVHDTVILDASCVISLYASGQMEGILKAFTASVAVAAYVSDSEAHWVYSRVEERGREPIILEPFVEEGLLKIVTVDTESEAEMVVSLAAQRLDQGEAVTGAIAIRRGWAIATDDKRARRLLQEKASDLQVIYTLELVQYWAEHNAIPPHTVSRTLQNIRQLATYRPHNRHPLYDWWHEHEGG